MSRLKLEPKYITDAEGVKTAVVLDMRQYKKLLELAEEAEDIEYAKSVHSEPTGDYHEYRRRKLKLKTKSSA
jgi:hypothetical protein